jgi:winged helix DNA-binding protein
MTIPRQDRVSAERYVSQLLAGPPAADALTVVERLLAVQAQDPRGARLAIRARTSGLSAADVDRALGKDRSMVIAWLNRGTLHLVSAEDYAWLHALTTPGLLTGNARRLAQEGVTGDAADRAVAVIARSLVENGPMTRVQLRDRVRAARLRTEGQALVHILALASHRGLIVRGPMVGKQHAFVLTRDWLGDAKPIDRDRARAELARRFLAGHAPATERDLAQWAGVPLRDARAGLQSIAKELVQRGDGMVSLASRKSAWALPRPRLLGSYEPVLLGWTSRVPILGDYVSRVTIEGVFRGFALVRGKGVATWSIQAGQVAVAPFGQLTARDAAALETDAEDVLRYLHLAPPATARVPARVDANYRADRARAANP